MKFLQGFVTALGLVVLCGQAKNDGTIRARKLEIVDPKGRVVITLDGAGSARGQAAKLTANGLELRSRGSKGNYAADGWSIYRENRSLRGPRISAGLGEVPGLIVKDGEGNATCLGALSLMDRQGREVAESAAAIHLYAKTGETLFKAPK